MTEKRNPLAKHFRQPVIYLKLPSSGKYWPSGAINMPATGEVPIFSMTARDEITIRTPDALLNGQAIVDVIQSCCPAINDAWKAPSIDIDALLIAIRIASYGNEMEFDTICPACKEENSFGVDLGPIMSGIKCPDYSVPLEVDGLKVFLEPQPYLEVNRVNQISFTEQQILRAVNDDSLSDDEKKRITDKYLANLVDLNINICVNSTKTIVTDDGIQVTEPEFIRDFYDNAEFKTLKTIQDRLAEYSAEVAIKPVHAACPSCSNEYDVPLDFDYANFFDRGF